MSAAAILALLNAVTTAIPAAIQLANEFKATASAEDQASVDALLAKIKALSESQITQAEADLDAAAKV